MAHTATLICARLITKTGVQNVADVVIIAISNSTRLRPWGIIGDNGADKSILIKAVSGADVPDEGEVYVEGRKVSFLSSLDAREHVIDQQLAMSPGLSIADNVSMGHELRKPGIMGKLFRQLECPRWRFSPGRSSTTSA